MFEFLFKYPGSVFTKGRLVFLSALPVWLLPVLIVCVCVSLALLTYRRIPHVVPKLRNWRVWSLAAMQSAFLALILLLLWQPAMTVAALSSHQNIIAVVLDNSRSMAISDEDGRTREAAALDVLEKNLLPGLQNRFQIRLYHLGKDIKQVDRFTNTQPPDTATNINRGLRHLAEDTTDLPIGAVLLLSDGGQNSVEMGSSGVALESLQALHNRRLPVHTIGFGRPELARDLEIENVSVAATAVVNSRLSAAISFVQYGYAGQVAKIRVRDGNKLLSSQEVKLAPNGVLQTESLFFSAGDAGARNLQFVIEPLSDEENLKNNQLTRPVLITDKQRRILYIEGEPRWEFKFIRRAEEDDPTIQLVSMLRTSENKIYRQGIKDPSELADGFPVRPEDLFGYSGIVIGSVDVNYFTPLQRELLREYVDRRGGGLLLLGGRMSLGNGGWEASSLNELIPTFLPAARNTFHRNPATVELTAEGKDSPITRLLDDPSKNADRWKKLTYLADYQDAGSPKPGASVLVQMSAGRKKLPLLITQSYGHGRTALLATGGTWRWQMAETLGDPSHNLFWQQLLRWLVADTAGPVSASVSSHTLSDEGSLRLTAQVHDAQFQPAANAHVSAHILGPDGINALIDLQPSQDMPGVYATEWSADKPGSYLTEIVAEDSSKQKQEMGRDVLTFRREDGIAEDFHTEQNRQLLRQLSSQTGGRYWTPDAIKDLPQAISYSEGGVSVRTTNELWNMPIVFLLLIAIPVTEWLLRRKWGMV
ncbi:glutamine amidotransferase [Edaphobacter modestus]|uniref:Putative membrane protein n=1 Tax=Edaphobacter modestus TaxID=388466 RepID=A0A4Q7YT18_9BACT|nr:glutamine amidotransferase [Edaphobacter modestus]RZU40015.1 putative membrane protein [Edaphobacter modestus]